MRIIFMLKQPESEKNSKVFVYCKFCYRGPETSKKTKISFEFFRFLGGSQIIQWPYFHSPLCHALYQPTNQISKESIHVCRIQSHTNLHRFHAQPASWRPFWISNFSQNSYIWHVVILSNMLTQYENNRTYYVDTMVIKRQMCHFYSEKWA